MNKIYIINYSVKGIKNLDDWAELSFYNKNIKSTFSIRQYNIKGIYGTNGAGKSGIIRSAEILKYLILDPKYLGDMYVQRQLNDLINRKTKTLEYKVDFLHKADKTMLLYSYEIRIKESKTGFYEIDTEKLCFKKATSSKPLMHEVYSTQLGDLNISTDDESSQKLVDLTKNLLTESTLPAIFRSHNKLIYDEQINDDIWNGIISLLLFGINLFVCMDKGDDHRSYYIYEYMDADISTDKPLISHINKLISQNSGAFSSEKMRVRKSFYSTFEKEAKRLFDFIKIFKADLQGIEIDKKEDEEFYICSLVMKYKNYKINAEFESTGIKKLIKLFDYLDKMVLGNIVFIDELDSNLHDVYLCALLEYLMKHAEGQLCFTTHNIGPMDILKRNKKSIDFLSTDHKIYSWTKNGNYSPSSLYKNGMIEGSAFNVFSFDFIGVFHSEGDE